MSNAFANLVQSLRGSNGVQCVTDAVAFEAFEHACKYYLGMSANEFLERYHAGTIDASTPGLERVLDLLPLVA
jgi:hypothetical protein